ncbi:MAG: PAS domain-containing protein, partial [Limnothrix sp.]
SQNRLLEAQRIAHIGSWEFEIETERLTWSAELHRMYGRDPAQDDLTAEQYWKYVHPDDHQKIRQSNEQAIATGKPYVIDYRVVLEDGSIRYHEGRGEVETGADGRAIRLFGTALDITDRQLTAIALQESETRWQFALEGSGDGTWDWNLEGDSVFFSPRWKAILGYRDDEIENSFEQWDWRIHPEDRDYVYEQIDRYLSGQIPIYNAEYRLQCKDGSYKWLLTRGKAIQRDETGKATRMIGTHTDISDRKQTELAIQEISQRLAIATQSAKIGIWEYNYIDNVLIWDEQMYQLYDTDPSEFGSNFDTWTSKLHPDDVGPSTKIFETILVNDAEEFSQEFRVVWSNGEIHHITFNAKIIRNTAGGIERLIGINWEITDYKRVEQALLQAKETAESAAQTKSMFLANMSHEIRTPMNGVIGMLHLLRDTKLTDKQRSQINIAQSSAESLLSLINDILDFSKVEAGKLEVEQIEFELHELLGSFAKTMALKAQEKGLELILDLRGIEHRVVKGDPGRLRQVLINLTSNAIKFTEQGEILLTCHLVRQANGFVFTGILTDQGIGIPENVLEHLFDPFIQMDASTTRKYGGTGLGLTITKKLCELMGGNISATSEVGKGSQFEFTIPLQLGEQTERRSPRILIEPLKLLLVDDNAVQREILSGQLRAWGVEVTEAVNGTSALALFDQSLTTNVFDIVLMDQVLPDMRSLVLGKALRAKANGSKFSIMMMTAIANESREIEGFDLEVTACLTKPILASELLDALVNISNGAATVQSEAQQAYARRTQIEQKQTAVVYPESIRLLLVEDNKVNQMVIRGLLKKMGLKISTALNGVEALWMLKESSAEKPYTCILMDCLMPEMDGYETTRQIRRGSAGELYLNIPILALTANAMKGDREKCLMAGMNDYLSKPINPETMRQVLNRWLIPEDVCLENLSEQSKR